jgi:cytoskeletal protein CcmA (bactofilin family)
MAESTSTGRLPPTIGGAPAGPAERRVPEMPARRVAAGQGNMVIGVGVQVSGAIGGCASISVHGGLQSEQLQCEALEVAAAGQFRGVATAGRAEISGTFSGRLIADIVVIQNTAKIEADIQYGELQIERGARVSGNLQAAK